MPQPRRPPAIPFSGCYLSCDPGHAPRGTTRRNVQSNDVSCQRAPPHMGTLRTRRNGLISRRRTDRRFSLNGSAVGVAVSGFPILWYRTDFRDLSQTIRFGIVGAGHECPAHLRPIPSRRHPEVGRLFGFHAARQQHRHQELRSFHGGGGAAPRCTSGRQPDARMGAAIPSSWIEIRTMRSLHCYVDGGQERYIRRLSPCASCRQPHLGSVPRK
jgi:hypothetical protein